MSNWEMFCDESYYNAWCVRNTEDKSFGSPTSFHMLTKQEAESLLEFLQSIEENKMSLSNTQTLAYILGWESGTVYQVAETLNVDVGEILDADVDKMRELSRLAQSIRGTKQFLQD
jgi:hypothetical protein